MTGDAGPFQWFWAGRVTRSCPSCGNRTATGFNREDPGADGREPSKCAGCATDVISNSVRMDLTAEGYPRYEQGPCVSCQEPTRRYGRHGRPACDTCASDQARAPAPSPPVQEPTGAAVTELPGKSPQFGQANLEFAEVS